MKIQVTTADGVRELDLAEGAVLNAGRLRENELCIADNSVSRRHAVFSCRGGKIYVKDVGSHGGTFVNDAKIDSERALGPGDVVRIGTARVSAGGTRSGASASAAPSVLAGKPPAADRVFRGRSRTRRFSTRRR